MKSDQTPMDPDRAALESLYHERAEALHWLAVDAERDNDVWQPTTLAIARALADAHEDGRNGQEDVTSEEVRRLRAELARVLKERDEARRLGSEEATAAIVADLRVAAAGVRSGLLVAEDAMRKALHTAANRYERGEHTPAKGTE